MRPIILLLAAAAPIWAQQPPTFEVASVKPNVTDTGGGMRTQNDAIELENYSLRQLIQMAYRVRDYAYSGPSWLDSVHFDIVAKMPAGTKSDQRWEMMQALLVERFKLAVHREEKMMPGLALVVAKKGPRIKPVAPGPDLRRSGRYMIEGAKMPMAGFAEMLTDVLKAPVKDLTKLRGVYDIKIHWMPDGLAPIDPSVGDVSTSVYAAVQDQLGLKLQSQKLPVQILVVDHAERSPTGN
jgi:uncharacterized protein (TIGR03435 family)